MSKRRTETLWAEGVGSLYRTCMLFVNSTKPGNRLLQPISRYLEVTSKFNCPWATGRYLKRKGMVPFPGGVVTVVYHDLIWADTQLGHTDTLSGALVAVHLLLSLARVSTVYLELTDCCVRFLSYPSVFHNLFSSLSLFTGTVMRPAERDRWRDIKWDFSRETREVAERKCKCRCVCTHYIAR